MSDQVLTVTLNPSVDKTISIEKFVPFGLNRVADSRMDPGGKGINVARVLRNFGVSVTATGLIGGSQGKFLLGHLAQNEISADFYEIDAETRTNIKIQDLSNNKITEVNEKGFQVTEEDLNGFREKYRNLIQNSAVVVLSGSIPPGVPSEFYGECIRVAKNSGKKVVLDAEGEAFREGLRAVPFAVKPNLHELELAVGKTLETRSEVVGAVKDILAQGVETVIVSMGPKGAIVADQKEIYQVDSWDVEVKGATGAGDSMVGALAYSMLNGSSLLDIAKITTAAGTITVSKEGTQICGFQEVMRSLDYVHVHEIERCS